MCFGSVAAEPILSGTIHLASVVAANSVNCLWAKFEITVLTCQRDIGIIGVVNALICARLACLLAASLLLCWRLLASAAEGRSDRSGKRKNSNQTNLWWLFGWEDTHKRELISAEISIESDWLLIRVQMEKENARPETHVHVKILFCLCTYALVFERGRSDSSGLFF